MARFYLHLFDSIGYVADDEGHELPDLVAARKTAVESIRDLVAADARAGVIHLEGRIEIRNHERQMLETVHYTDAFAISKGSTA